MIRVNGDPLAHVPGMTVRDVLQARRFLFPLVIVKVNDQTVPRPLFETFVVPDEAEVWVLHLMSGG
ncbi:MAG: sulfur carrier protein ThiS [Myxococcota bacterium]|nr:sulfur carrier protein ThiS [Myxococcota bacterium]